MRVLVIEPLKKPEVRNIDSGLESLQDIVDGLIQYVAPFEEDIGVICNDEAKLLGLPLNRALYNEDGEIYDIIAGNIIVVCIDDWGDITDLSPQQIEKYYKHFEYPEQFAMVDDRIVRIQIK